MGEIEEIVIAPCREMLVKRTTAAAEHAFIVLRVPRGLICLFLEANRHNLFCNTAATGTLWVL